MKNKITNRVLSVLLCVVMLIGCIPLSVNAAEVIAEGSCGTGLNWTLDANYKLIISGEGAMTNWTASSSVPWYNYRGNITSVVIEDGVTSIGDRAFYYCSSLTDVSLPEGLETLGYGVFFECKSLTDIALPLSVTSIGNYAFRKCASLETVNLGGAESIGISAFHDCTSLASIYVSESLSSIGTSAFANAPASLTFYGVSGSYAEEYAIENGINFIDGLTWTIDDEGNFTVSGEGDMSDFAASASVPWATVKDRIVSVTIEEGITSIGDRAFYGCSNLVSVSIPESVTKIGYGAFFDCTSLSSVTIPENVTCLGDYSFRNCTALEAVTFEGSVKEIGKYAFYNNKVLESITLPDGLVSIGEAAFNSCKALKSVTIPVTVTTIGSNAFLYCPASLVVYGYTGSYAQTYASANSLSFSSLGLGGLCGDSVTWVYRLGTLTISGTGAMDDYATSSAVPWANYKSSATTLVIGDEVTTIGDKAFYQFASLTDLTIGDSVTSIGDAAFYQCSKLTEVVIPDGVTEIGNYAFRNSTKLAGVTIPESVTSIGTLAFAGCPTTLVIYGYEGSYAETYAADNGFAFAAPVVEPEIYTVTFVVNGEVYSSYEAEEGSTLVYPEAPVVDGYTFDGWDVAEGTVIGEDMTVTAVLTAIQAPDYYVVEGEDLEGAHGVMLSSSNWATSTYVDETGIDPSYVRYEITADEDYTFTDGQRAYLALSTGDNTVEATPYLAISYRTNNAVKMGINPVAYTRMWGSSVVFDLSVSDNWQTIVLDMTSMTGGSMGGWDVAKGYPFDRFEFRHYGTNIGATAIPGHYVDIQWMGLFETEDDAMNYQPDFAPTAYRVSYNANGGVGAPEAEIVEIGTDYVIPSDIPEFDDFTFAGWSTTDGGEVEYLPGDTYSEDRSVALYAVWEEDGLIAVFADNDLGGYAAYGDKVTFDVINDNSEEFAYVRSTVASATLLEDDARIILNAPTDQEVKYIKISYRSNYDRVRLHMNPQYVINDDTIRIWSTEYDRLMSAPGEWHEIVYDLDSIKFNGAYGCGFATYAEDCNDETAAQLEELFASEDEALSEIHIRPFGDQDDTTVQDMTFEVRYIALYGDDYANDYETKTVTYKDVRDDSELLTKVKNFEGYEGDIFDFDMGLIHSEDLSDRRWSTEPYGEVVYTIEDEFVVTDDITLYYVWDSTVTYDANGGENAPAAQEKSVDDVLVLTEEMPTRDGYNFIGWSTTPDGEVEYVAGGTYTRNADVTLYAVWGEAAVTVTFIVDDENYAETFVNLGDVIDLPDDPVIEGKRFTGWIDAEGNEVTADTIVYSDMTVYAQFVDAYTVTYMANETEVYDTQAYDYGDVIVLPAVPELEGYTFTGWYTEDGTEITDGIAVEGNITAYAEFEALTYTVTYDANGGEGAPEAQTKVYGEVLTLSTDVPVLAGYDFVGWSTTVDGEAEYLAGGQYPFNESVTLYAVWRYIPRTFTVTYDANGGEGAPESQTKTEGISLTLSNETPVRDGYFFKGWSTAADGEVEYRRGSEYTLDSDVTLYALWASNDSPTIAVETKTGYLGSKLNVTIKLLNNPGVAFMRLMLDYDTDVFSLRSVSDGGLLGEASHSDNLSLYPYTLLWTNPLITNNITNNGTIVTLTFDINRNEAVLGNYEFSVSYDNSIGDIMDVDFNTVDFEIMTSNVKIITGLIGDANEDGVVSVIDSVIISRYFARWIGYGEDCLNKDLADVNRDSRVNAADAAIIARYLAGWQGYESLPYVPSTDNDDEESGEADPIKYVDITFAMGYDTAGYAVSDAEPAALFGTVTRVSGEELAINSIAPTLDGQVFSGWSADDGVTLIQPGETITVPDVNTTYSAIWADEPVYTTVINGIVTESDDDTDTENNAVLADVLCTAEVDGETYECYTDEDGVFNFGEIPGTDVTLTFSADGYIDAVITIAEATDEALFIVMDKEVSNTLSGRITVADDDTDYSNNESLADAAVSIRRTTSTNALVATVYTDPDGYYSFTDLTAGVYELTVECEGYITVKQRVTVKYNETNIQNIVIEAVSVEEISDGYAAGYVTDAKTGFAVEGISVNIRAGLNNTEGEPIMTVYTTSLGEYITDGLVPGNYTAEFADERELDDEDYRYGTVTIAIKILSDITIGNQNATISNNAEITIDGMRMVLTWGETPTDLDSHLYTTLDDGSEYHVYFGDKNPTTAASLDVDDTTSYGPETITISSLEGGIYSYYIHDFTNRNTTDSTVMGNSGAAVAVYTSASASPVYNLNVPSGTGVYWHVFDYDSNTGEFTIVNELSNTLESSETAVALMSDDYISERYPERTVDKEA